MLAIFDDSNSDLYRLTIYLLVVVVVGVTTAIRAIYRYRSMMRFASDNQFEHLGKELVDGLYLRNTTFAWRDVKVSNSLKGSIRGVEIAVFDISYAIENPSGRRAQRLAQTVAAFRREGTLRCTDLPSTGEDIFHIEIAGDWLICFTDGQQVNTLELDSWCSEMYDRTVQLVQQQVNLRPAML